MGTFREFERAATTEVDAALSPLLAGYLRRLRRALRSRRPARADDHAVQRRPDRPRAAADHAAWTVLSGPAGGAAGAAFVARAAGTPDALCFDMGGTSCDVCVVDDGACRSRARATIAGRPLALPMVAVHTVGAGGGSIAWRDPGGALRVGPRSAGADPGPACYGRGGTEPTVTDANLVLGYLAADAPLAGGVELDSRRRRARDRRARRRARARAAGVRRGDRPRRQRRDGARAAGRHRRSAGSTRAATRCSRSAAPGPLHAAAIADELGITEIVCPRASGVLAALGLVVSPRRRDVQRSVLLAGDELTADAVAG